MPAPNYDHLGRELTRRAKELGMPTAVRVVAEAQALGYDITTRTYRNVLTGRTSPQRRIVWALEDVLKLGPNGFERVLNGGSADPDEQSDRNQLAALRTQVQQSNWPQRDRDYLLAVLDDERVPVATRLSRGRRVAEAVANGDDAG